MIPPTCLTTARILEAFEEEIASRGGNVTDTFHDGRRLFTRSVFDRVLEVRPGDRLQGGVALKATKVEICLYPYAFRQVCRNGAIMAHTISSRVIRDLPDQETETVLERVREGVAACCEPDVFPGVVRQMRTASEGHVDLALNLLPFLSRLSGSAGAQLVASLMDRFFRDGDQSHFGLGNAITAVARDTEDPELRWNLEEFGGGILIGAAPRYPIGRGGAAAVRSDVAVGVV
jgi:hypothetical protein